MVAFRNSCAENTSLQKKTKTSDLPQTAGWDIYERAEGELSFLDIQVQEHPPLISGFF